MIKEDNVRITITIPKKLDNILDKVKGNLTKSQVIITAVAMFLDSLQSIHKNAKQEGGNNNA